MYPHWHEVERVYICDHILMSLQRYELKTWETHLIIFRKHRTGKPPTDIISRHSKTFKDINLRQHCDLTVLEAIIIVIITVIITVIIILIIIILIIIILIVKHSHLLSYFQFFTWKDVLKLRLNNGGKENNLTSWCVLLCMFLFFLTSGMILRGIYM